MSRVPSYLENGLAPGGTRRNTGTQAPRVGVQESLGAPGLEALPPESRLANLMADVDKSIGMAGNFAANLGADQRRRKAEQERAEEQAKALLEGQAHDLLAVDIEKFQEDVRQGKYDDQLDDDSETVARSFADSQTDGLPKAGKDYYASRGVPKIMDMLRGRREYVADKAAKDNSLKALSRFSGSESSTDAKKVYDQTRSLFPTWTDEQYLAATVIPAASSAARLGEEGRKTVESLLPLMGDAFRAEAQEITKTLNDAIYTQRSRRWTEGANRIGMMFAERETAEDPMPLSVLKHEIDSAAKRGDLDPNTADGYLQRIRAEQDRSAAVFQKALDAEAERRWRDELAQSDLNLTMGASVTGGLASITEDATIEIGGKTITVNKEKRRENATNAAMARFVQQGEKNARGYLESGSNQKEAITRAERETVVQQTNWLNLNGASYQNWKDRFNAGVLAANPANLRGSKELPANLGAATSLYRQMSQDAPSLLLSHMDKATLTFFDMHETARRHITGGDEREAAIMVANAMPTLGRTTSIDNVDRQDLANDFSGEYGEGIRNASQHLSTMETLFRLKVALGDSRSKARADTMDIMKRDLIKSGDYLIDGANLPKDIRENFGDFSTFAIDRFLRTAMKEPGFKDEFEGADAGDFVFVQTEPGVFQVAYATTGRPVSMANDGDIPALRSAATFRYGDFLEYLRVNKQTAAAQDEVAAPFVARDTVSRFKQRKTEEKGAGPSQYPALQPYGP